MLAAIHPEGLGHLERAEPAIGDSDAAIGAAVRIREYAPSARTG